MCACLPQQPWLFIFSSRGHDRQSPEQNNRKLISLHNNGDYTSFGWRHFFPENLIWNTAVTLLRQLFMHVSSRNMFPTIRNLQNRVHVYPPRHRLSLDNIWLRSNDSFVRVSCVRFVYRSFVSCIVRSFVFVFRVK
jgi:hypothetical protein